MSQEEAKALLAKLQDELQTIRIDKDTRVLLEDLDTHIHKILADSTEDHQPGLIEKAEELETRFAAEHPVAEGIARELIEILGKMGI